jgi:L-alanine-DL-glutamate epimerase-like enolase superfamily enzyme
VLSLQHDDALLAALVFRHRAGHQSLTPFISNIHSKTVPIINDGVEVPQDPGLGADPEDDLIAQFRV